MDIKAKIEEIVKKVKSDDTLQERFKKDPVKTVEEIAGVDLPADTVNKIVDGVKAKISVDKAGDVLGKLKKLF